MIAIHTKSGSFAKGWIAYCEEHGIPYKIVDCYASDIIERVRGCTALLWHWEHNDQRARFVARQLTMSLEKIGIKLFPNTNTAWYFDDKIGQKYLLEAIRAPLVPTHVFYERVAALEWVKTATFPKVWKLRGGAGSQNVALIHNAKQAKKVIRKSFSKGWRYNRFHALKERIWQLRRFRSIKSVLNVGRGFARAIKPHEKYRYMSPERGYVYFQDFIPKNTFDVRVVTIGMRAFAIKRHTRDGDFRASGSGYISYNIEEISEKYIELAFQLSEKIGAQSAAYDFIMDAGEIFLIEISYAFSLSGYVQCPGYWDRHMNWHETPFSPTDFMMEDILSQIYAA